MKKRIIYTSLFALSSLGIAFASTALAQAPAKNTDAVIEKIRAQAPTLKPAVLKTALKGFAYAKQTGEVHKNILTVVDFNLPSSQKRLWVINLNNDKVLMNLLVAQGKNSGLFKATHFSNQPGSLDSSLGVYTTGQSYYGHHGYSMHVNGLEEGLNSNAYKRAIEVHPAAYVTPNFVKLYHRTGRSWGCFAVNPKKSKQLINSTKGGSVIFAYAPQEQHDIHLADVNFENSTLA